jgi:CubicO group peptidase (beta-lactamase class C family)
MTSTDNTKAAALIALALAIGATGLYLADADDASFSGPGPAGLGLLLMIGAVVLGVKAARNRMPAWAARTVLAVGVLIAASTAFVTHTAARTAPLFAQPQDVPSVIDSAPPAQYAPVIERARALVRAAVLEQNLSGVSVAVGIGSSSAASVTESPIVWAEGFGWRDTGTRTPVTPGTRFNIGSAAPAVTAAAVASLGLTSTGAEPAEEWSPEAAGSPGEDFPPFTLMRHLVFQPLGLAPAEYPLPGDRATFYVPRSDDDPLRGRRLMYMRDLACCAGTQASYSTASDLVRIGLANGVSINGELAGGMVASLTTLGDSGVVVAVLSNIAHANTSALAMRIGDAFAQQVR